MWFIKILELLAVPASAFGLMILFLKFDKTDNNESRTNEPKH